MVLGCEEKCDAYILNTGRGLLGGQREMNPERGQHVGAAAFAGDGAIAVFGHFDAVAGHHEGCRGADIEGAAAVTARAHNVDQHGFADGRGNLHGAAFHGKCAAGDLVNRLALHAQRSQKRADLGWAGLAQHDLGHGGVGQVDGEILVSEEAMDGSLNGGLRWQCGVLRGCSL